MSAPETLLRAAAHLRDLAKVDDPQNYPLPWGTEQADLEHFGLAAYVTCEGGKGELTDALDDDIARYFASLHPGVALAAADALALYAELIDEDSVIPMDHKMLAFARACLGEQSSNPLPPYTRPTTCGECGDDLAPGQMGWHGACFAMQDGA